MNRNGSAKGLAIALLFAKMRADPAKSRRQWIGGTQELCSPSRVTGGQQRDHLGDVVAGRTRM
jgi:hypothetical protein